MQVGPAITPSPESKLTLDLKEYASKPLTFIHRQLLDRGPDVTRELIERTRVYPFISDLFGEWLARNDDRSPAAGSVVLVAITREVIGGLTLSELCEALQRPLTMIGDEHGSVAPETAGTLLRELHLSSLANRVEQNATPFKPEDLEKILSGKLEASTSQPADYNEFLTELREAGVIIPPSSKDRTSKPQAKPPIAREARSEASVRATQKSTKVRPKPSTVGIEPFFSPDARAKIMTKIFKDDSGDFDRSMELLNKAKDWKQASIYLDALFMRRKVDPFSKTAIRLTDAVYARFNSLR